MYEKFWALLKGYTGSKQVEEENYYGAASSPGCSLDSATICAPEMKFIAKFLHNFHK